MTWDAFTVFSFCPDDAVENTFIHENVHSKEGFHGVMCATPKMEVFQKAESFKAALLSEEGTWTNGTWQPTDVSDGSGAPGSRPPADQRGSLLAALDSVLPATLSFFLPGSNTAAVLGWLCERDGIDLIDGVGEEGLDFLRRNARSQCTRKIPADLSAVEVHCR